MARNVFFSFPYKHVWKVNQIRSMPNVTGTAAAGFFDNSLWEDAKKTGGKIERMIDKALKGTTVTVVCVAYGTKNRKYIDYEIDKSLARGNALLAVQIHNFKDQYRQTGRAGAIPGQIAANGYKAYKYTNKEALARWIEQAYKLAQNK